jgi:hypothetical protein
MKKLLGRDFWDTLYISIEKYFTMRPSPSSTNVGTIVKKKNCALSTRDSKTKQNYDKTEQTISIIFENKIFVKSLLSCLTFPFLPNEVVKRQHVPFAFTEKIVYITLIILMK